MSDLLDGAAWNDSLEEYFSSLGERSHCLNWLHARAEISFSAKRVFIDLPVIILSAVTGFASVGSTTLFTDQRLASVILGVVSLFVSILNTTGTYFNFAKRAEAHRISAIEYAKLFRYVLVEMSLPRAERLPPKELLRMTKEATDRLAEVSPLIPTHIIADFRRQFEDNVKYKDVSKPEITNGLEAIYVFRGEEEEAARRARRHSSSSGSVFRTLSPLHLASASATGTPMSLVGPPLDVPDAPPPTFVPPPRGG
jgi:hypothetical protein